MYAVIKTGGKQHKVKTGETIHVELLEGNPGDKVVFDPILVVDDSGVTHVGKAKTGYKRTQGHRQNMTIVEIEEIAFKVKKAAAKKESAPKAAEAAPTEESAPKAPAKAKEADAPAESAD